MGLVQKSIQVWETFNVMLGREGVEGHDVRPAAVNFEPRFFVLLKKRLCWLACWDQSCYTMSELCTGNAWNSAWNSACNSAMIC